MKLLLHKGFFIRVSVLEDSNFALMHVFVCLRNLVRSVRQWSIQRRRSIGRGYKTIPDSGGDDEFSDEWKVMQQYWCEFGDARSSSSCALIFIIISLYILTSLWQGAILSLNYFLP